MRNTAREVRVNTSAIVSDGQLHMDVQVLGE